MSIQPDPASSAAAQPRRDDADYRLGPRLALHNVEGLQSFDDHRFEGPTWRGWLTGIVAVAVLSILVPYADFVLQAAMFSFNSFPMLPVLLVLGMVAVANLALYFGGSRLGLKKQDLVLACIMTTVVFAIPGVQFWTFWSTAVTSPYYHETKVNRWAELLHPYLTPGLFPSDPKGQNPGPRPIEWFYGGLPPGQSVPWGSWAGIFGLWMIVVAFMYGLWFSVAALIQRRWSDQERLPFPISQVPEELLSGYDDPASSGKGILRQRLFLLGILISFAAHATRGLHGYFSNFPELPLMNWNLQTKYLTEEPWKFMGVLHMHIYLSVIGLTYLLSLDVAFSLWFFYWIQKIINLMASNTYGQENLTLAYNAQGSGGLLALVIFGFWAARGDFKQSLREALGLAAPEKQPGDFSARTIWLVLAGSFVGAVAWLCWAGVSLIWAVPIVGLFVLVMTGMARLVAEAGVFAMQIANFPVHLLTTVAPPAVLGGKSYVMLTIWDRIFTADWFRICPMPNIMNSLHLARSTGLRSRTALAGMALSVVLMFGLSFFTYFSQIYPIGANNSNWFLSTFPAEENARTARTMAVVQGWEKKVEAAAGKEIPDSEIPSDARTNWKKLAWLAVGFVTIGGFNIARRFLFWWPHPAGYVLWMASTIDRLWFSFFLGWAIKWAISKYGGMRFYTEMRRFFIGLVIGEALAALFWALLAILLTYRGGYALQMG